MCHNWFSIVGLCFDIVGFLLIASEWHHVFTHEYRNRLFELEHDSERTRAERQGQEYEDPRGADHTMWRDIQRVFVKDWKFRRLLFYVGVGLVLLGFIGQVLGSLPNGVLGRTC
jgi:hypothetical protein